MEQDQIITFIETFLKKLHRRHKLKAAFIGGTLARGAFGQIKPDDIDVIIVADDITSTLVTKITSTWTSFLSKLPLNPPDAFAVLSKTAIDVFVISKNDVKKFAKKFSSITLDEVFCEFILGNYENTSLFFSSDPPFSLRKCQGDFFWETLILRNIPVIGKRYLSRNLKLFLQNPILRKTREKLLELSKNYPSTLGDVEATLSECKENLSRIDGHRAAIKKLLTQIEELEHILERKPCLFKVVFSKIRSEVIKKEVEHLIVSSKEPLSSFKQTGETEFTREIQDLLYEEIKDNVKGKRVLDIGCEKGRLAGMLAKDGAEVCGMDINPEHINRARVINAGENCQFKTGDIRENIPFDGKFDIMIATGVFESYVITDMNEIKKSLANISRKLRKGGGFYTGFSGDGGIIDESTANEFEMTYEGYVINRKTKRDKVLVDIFKKS